MSKEDNLKAIFELADKFLGEPRVVACRACHQKNRVSPGNVAAGRVPRCGKCGLALPVR